jgi:hypothetical protein
MVTRLIRLRLLQLYRGSGGIGLFRVLLVVVILMPLIVLFLIQRIALYPWSIAIPAAALYIIWLIHARRRDYHFLSAIMPNPRAVFIAEYVLFSIAVPVLLLYGGLYLHALLFSIGLIMITFKAPLQVMNSSRVVKLSMIPAGMFEWQSGIRKNLIAVFLFYIPGLFGFYQLWFSALSLLLLTMIFISFYSEYEPRNMIAAGSDGSLHFLLKKVARDTGCFAILLLPLVCIALTHGDYLWLTLGYFLASLNLLAFSILLKYHQYRPGAYSGAHQMLTTLAGIVSVVLPVALLIAVFNLFLAAGAKKNLKIYLDAYN